MKSMASKKNSDGNIESFTREYLRRIDAKLDRIDNDMRDIRFRMTQVEGSLANHSAQLVHHTGQFDRLFDEIHLIKKRLDMVDA